MPSSAAARARHVASAPPPTWTNTRSMKWPMASITSKPIDRPVSRHSAFSGPWTAKGMAPAATASRNRCTQGSPGGSSATRGQTVTSAPSSRRRATTGAAAQVGTNTSTGHAAALARVAAASAALPQEAMASRRSLGDGRHAELLGGQQVQQDAGEVPAPCGSRPRCPCRPSPARRHRGRTPGPRSGAGSGRTGVTTKPTPSTAVTASSRERTSLARSSAPIPWASAKAAHAYRLSKATSGLGSSPNRTGAGGRTRNMTWWRSAAVAFGHRHGHGVATGDLGPADRTAEAGDHGSATVPVRSLNSTISSSHTEVSVRSSRQKCCDRRASNTSSGVSCCSTQV